MPEHHSPSDGSGGQRPLRVGEALRHALSDILARGDLRDPDLRDISITVTEVRLSPDLRVARAFVTPLGGAESTAVLAALERATPYLRRRLAGLVKLRFAPSLTFALDTRFDHATQVDRLLDGAGQATHPGTGDDGD